MFFGVYGGAIYHHGAGFRDAELTRLHHTLAPRPGPLPRFGPARALARRRNQLRRARWEREMKRRLLTESERMYERIRAGGREWLDELL